MMGAIAADRRAGDLPHHIEEKFLRDGARVSSRSDHGPCRGPETFRVELSTDTIKFTFGHSLSWEDLCQQIRCRICNRLDRWCR